MARDQRNEVALRRLVAEIASMKPDDVAAILERMPVVDRQEAQGLLREYLGISTPIETRPSEFATPTFDDFGRFSDALVARAVSHLSNQHRADLLKRWPARRRQSVVTNVQSVRITPAASRLLYSIALEKAPRTGSDAQADVTLLKRWSPVLSRIFARAS